MRLLKSLFYSESHLKSVTFSWNHPNHKVAGLSIVWEELKSHTAGGTKLATDRMGFKTALKSIWKNHKLLFVAFSSHVQLL